MDVLIKAALSENSENNFLLPLAGRSVVDAEHSSEEVMVDVGNEGAEDSDIDVEASMVAYSELQMEAEEVAPALDQAKLDELVESAKEEGYRDGYNESVLEVQSKYNEQLETFDSLLSALDDVVPEYLKKSETVIASIVFESVCKIISAALADRSQSLEVVRNTIKNLDQKSVREVLINQSDFDVLEALKKDLTTESELVGSLNQFVFKVDQTIQHGGCKVKLVDGYLNATIDSQLEVLSKSLIKKAEELTR